ncbi:MAG: ATP-dependent helicase, partial [Dehalococcoidia bacterium]|nr:ATP-dependent helicase [Dehalococcoidia bacterium]
MLAPPQTDPLADLNDPQKEAVTSTKGALLINACPGSGKTLVLTRRAAHILNSEDISPSRICAVTFTNKAAGEMKTRMRMLAGSDADGVTASTFHSLCARILRQYGEHIGVPPEYVIYDENDTKQSIKAIIKNTTGESPAPSEVEQAMTAISTAKNLGQTSENAVMDEELRRIYADYEETLWRSDALDFDDLLLRTILLFENSPPVADELSSRYVYVMVDEFQDASAMQYRIAARLAATYGNLCVVGDPDQSIYGWRQSDIRNFLTFREEFPDRREIMLDTNYRSSGAVIKVASNLM